jgi:hypothetical protein
MNQFDFKTILFSSKWKRPLNSLCADLGLSSKNIITKKHYSGKYPTLFHQLPYAYYSANDENKIEEDLTLLRSKIDTNIIQISVKYHCS